MINLRHLSSGTWFGVSPGYNLSFLQRVMEFACTFVVLPFYRQEFLCLVWKKEFLLVLVCSVSVYTENITGVFSSLCFDLFIYLFVFNLVFMSLSSTYFLVINAVWLCKIKPKPNQTPKKPKHPNPTKTSSPECVTKESNCSMHRGVWKFSSWSHVGLVIGSFVR